MPTYIPPSRGGVPIRIAQPVTVQQGPGGARSAPAYQGAPAYGGSVYVHPPGGAAPQPSSPQPPAYGGGGYGYPDPYAGGYSYDPYGYGGYYPQMSSPYGYGYPDYYGGGMLGMFGGLLANGPHDELSPEEEYAIRQFYSAMRQRR